MRVYCLGISHRTAPVELRERLAVPDRQLSEVLDSVRDLAGVDEAVVLSTCNRVEIYAAAQQGESAADPSGALLNWLSARSPDPPGGEVFYRHASREAIEHLFSVASGLDSMVLGETEILGQLKSAYAHAHRAGATGRALNRLFQSAFRVAKRIRTQTEIARGATSVGGAGVDLAEKIFGDLRRCQVLILGAGKMSRRTAQSLQSRGASGIIVSNRSFERAQQIARVMGGQAIRFDEWTSKLDRADIVISSTSAPHHIVTAEALRPHLRQRHGRPLFLIDLAVPRDVDPAVRRLDGVYLHDIDTLQGIAHEARKRRESQIAACCELISAEADTLLSQWAGDRRLATALPSAGELARES
ncbi:MAG TPA: glutamyl-tRNA reductase [Verrucomicrobiales bacterium]|nr:glutamyl-tRNA reductase [Verrucomicrobiales bacterium]